jgi:3-phosphoglycerate kinase
MQFKPLTATQVSQKTVFLRVDYNVPLKKKGKTIKIANDSRIQSSLKTLKFLLKNHAKVIIASHLGRPGGKPRKNLSLKPVAEHLEKLLKKPVLFAPKITTSQTKKAAQSLKPGEVLILENIRFTPKEEANNPKFALFLAELADIYVNEAFSTTHRKHASIVGIPKHLPSFAGFAFREEVKELSKLLKNPKRPFVMVVGGAKISDKISAIENLTQIADAVLVGGGVANNFLKAEGYNVCKSYLQDKAVSDKKNTNFVQFAKKLITKTKHDRILKDNYIPLPKIIYPIDVKAAPALTSKTSCEIELINGYHKQAMKKDLMYLDIGHKTTKLFTDLINQAQTVFWNGPMGVYENPTFESGTQIIAQNIANAQAYSIIGGGDTIAAINSLNPKGRYDYISAAGGAALEFLSGKVLPGIKPLLTK